MGTSQIKAGLLDERGEIRSISKKPNPAAETWNGFLGFDADACLRTVYETIRDAVDQTEGAQVEALSLTNQRATVVPVGKEGQTLCPALSWQDTSSGDAVDAFMSRFGADRFTQLTGLPPSVLWSLAKVLRLKADLTDVFRSASRFVLLHDFVLKGLGADRFVTDPSNASVSGFMDVKSLAWSGEILEAAGLREGHLPELVPSGGRAGELDTTAAAATGLPRGTPLIVGGGDQQCSTLGVGAVRPGDAGLCLGTAAVVSCPVDHPITEAGGEFFCTAHAAPGAWVLEGIHNAFGSSALWVAAAIGCESLKELDAIAAGSVPGAHGVVFLPFMSGIGSPEYDAKTAGTVYGLRLSSTKEDLARAAIEGTSFEMRRILDALDRYANVGSLLVGGGRLAGPTANQALADILDRELVMVEGRDTTLLGAAALAWVGAGRYDDVVQALERMAAKAGEHIGPGPARDRYRDLYEAYCRFVDSARSSYA
jgi:sugar (pentulose or hexulose) kinase